MSSTESAAGPLWRWLREFWTFYRGYVHTAAHAASAAALTAFGLLAFVDRLFVLLAIAAYVFPPLVLYGLDADVGSDAAQTSDAPADRDTTRTTTSTGARSDSNADPVARADADSGDADADGRDSDTDSDDGDTDSDSDDGDTDADSDG